jgi:hypothetical protein
MASARTGRRPCRSADAPAASCLRDLRDGWLLGGPAVARDHPPSQGQQHHDREHGGPELPDDLPFDEVETAEGDPQEQDLLRLTRGEGTFGGTWQGEGSRLGTWTMGGSGCTAATSTAACSRGSGSAPTAAIPLTPGTSRTIHERNGPTRPPSVRPGRAGTAHAATAPAWWHGDGVRHRRRTSGPRGGGGPAPAGLPGAGMAHPGRDQRHPGA